MKANITFSSAVYNGLLMCWYDIVSKTYGLFDGFQDNVPDHNVSSFSRLRHANDRRTGDKERQSNNTKTQFSTIKIPGALAQPALSHNNFLTNIWTCNRIFAIPTFPDFSAIPSTTIALFRSTINPAEFLEILRPDIARRLSPSILRLTPSTLINTP